MSKQHVDYASAVKDLKSIFGRLLCQQIYSKYDFEELLVQWAIRWAKPTKSAYLSELGHIQLAGNTIFMTISTDLYTASILGVGKGSIIKKEKAVGVSTRITELEINKLLRSPVLEGLYDCNRFPTQGIIIRCKIILPYDRHIAN